MRSRITEEIRKELDDILQEKGSLKAEDIFEFAKTNKGSAIHTWFEEHNAFDASRALEEWGMLLARRMIMRVRIVTPSGAGTMKRIRAYVSLLDDRMHGVGYRNVITVLADDNLRHRLVETFRKDLEAFRKRYSELESLEPFGSLFAEMEKILHSGEERKAG